jgi:hypothetical protein
VILVDTSVWADHLRAGDKTLAASLMLAASSRIPLSSASLPSAN